MRVWYDTEFWESGNRHPIVPISYGFVRDDGQELYLIDADAPLTAIAHQHPWLRENVLPHLPVTVFELPHGGWRVEWDEDHPDIEAVMSGQQLRRVLEPWLLSSLDDSKVMELWGWYSAYDHVVLAQTFGTMSDMPVGIPWYTHDVRQAIPRVQRVPVQKPETEHNALADARWTRDVHRWWDARQAQP